jgi:ubiquinone/menaquinone biosynthesis C-methylase UbiE
MPKKSKVAAEKKPPASTGGGSDELEADENDAFGYCQESYWDNRYKDEAGHLEWYFGFDQLKDLFDPYVIKEVETAGHKELRVLESGCGDAPLLIGLSDAYSTTHKIGRLDGIDYAESVIKLLNTKEKIGDRKITFAKMDARYMDFFDNEFNIVLDKGTVDAMLCSNKGFEDVRNLFHEYCRVLMDGGKIVMISHMAPDSEEFHDFLEMCVYPVFDYRTNRLWSINAHVIASEEKPIQVSSKKRKVKESEDEDDVSTPAVYIFSPTFRRKTRVSDTYQPYIDFQLHEH